MGLGIFFDEVIDDVAKVGIATGNEFLEGRIFEDEVAVAHGAFNFADGVADDAADADIGLG